MNSKDDPISLVVAVNRRGVIGREGRIPWRLPADLKRFRAITWGDPIIMGRRTFESIGRVLPGRTNLVLSASGRVSNPDIVLARDLDEAIERGRSILDGGQGKEIHLVGGTRVFELGLPRARRIYLTLVDDDQPGDATFPLERLDDTHWVTTAEEFYPSEGDSIPAHRFRILQRSPEGSPSSRSQPT